MRVSIDSFKHNHHIKMRRTKGPRFASEKYLGTPLYIHVEIVLLKSVGLLIQQEWPFGTLLDQDKEWYMAGDKFYVSASTDGVTGKLQLYFDHWSFDPASNVSGNEHYLASRVRGQGLLCSEVVGNCCRIYSCCLQKESLGPTFKKH